MTDIVSIVFILAPYLGLSVKGASLCLDLGAFRSSPVESLYVEAH